jgi:DNA-directed RNA polymerase specialized sigma subunit
VGQHQKLVHLMVNRCLNNGSPGAMEREDLVSWGLLGLVQAAWFWDPAHGASFSTVACRGIE